MYSAINEREASPTWSSLTAYRRFSDVKCGLIGRLHRVQELHEHDGCVNTVSFTPDGRRLISGSDDQRIIIWDWCTGQSKLAWNSGHTNNVFQARTIGVGANIIASCAADGQVRLHTLSSSGYVRSRRIGKHAGRAHKLALDPQQLQCFYSSGEDAAVRHYDVRQPNAGSTKLLVVHSAVPCRKRQQVDLNGIHVNPTNCHEFVVGGDEEYAYVYDVRKLPSATLVRSNPVAEPVARYCPRHLASDGRRPEVHITACVFSRHGELLVTYNDDDIYLFDPRVRRGHRSSGAQVQRNRRRLSSPTREGKRACKGRGAPSSSGAAPPPVPLAEQGSAGASAVTGRDAGPPAPAHDAAPLPDSARAARGADTPDPAGPSVHARTPDSAVAGPRQSASGLHSGSDHGDATDDGMQSDTGGASEPLHTDSSSDPSSQAGSLSEDESWDGDSDSECWMDELPTAARFVGGASRNGAAPASEHAICSATPDVPSALWSHPGDDCVVQRFSGHRNLQTVKGVSFMGADEEYVVSGSDCGHVFVWSKRDGRLRQMVHGDEHVVNCLEPHPLQPLILATSGIENSIKIWAPELDPGARGPQDCDTSVMRENMEGLQARRRRALLLTPGMHEMLLLRALIADRMRPASEEEELDDSDEEEVDDSADDDE